MTRNLIFALSLCLFAACSGCNSARNPEADKIAVKKAVLQMDDAYREGNADVGEASIKLRRTALKKINVRSCPEDFRVAFEELRSAIIKQMEFYLKHEGRVPDGKIEEGNRLRERFEDTKERLETIANRIYGVQWRCDFQDMIHNIFGDGGPVPLPARPGI